MYTFEYTQTLRDLISFNWFHFRTSKAASRNRIFLLIAFIGIFLLLSGDLMETLISSVILVIVWYLALPLLIPVQCYINYISGRNKATLGKLKLEINDGGIIETSSVSELKYDWHAIENIRENKKYLFIYTSASSGFILPKNVFKNMDEMNALRLFVQDKIGSSRTTK